MSINKDAFKIGNFGFFKDSELKLRMDDENLYDQISSDGTIDVWFGGNGVWLPDFGLFDVYVTCEQSFFWDIVDGEGKRTKDGFSEMQIPFNNNFKPWVGDLIPINKDEVFDYTIDSPSVGNNKLICSNLWFYTNLFHDEYYRYNLLIQDKSISPDNQLDEINVRLTPMNDKLTIHDNEYIFGYRPKIEYMNQLAVLKTIRTGDDYKILFRFKVDMDFLSDNPTAIRKLRIFSQTGDTIKYTLYPRSPNDIIWRNNKGRFVNRYERYLLDNGVSQYLPGQKELTYGDNMFTEYMSKSNLVLHMDGSYLRDVAADFTQIINGEEIHSVGYTSLLRNHFPEWLKWNQSDEVVTELYDILKKVVLARTYYKGFTLLAEAMGITIDKPGTPEVEGLINEVTGPIVNLKKVDGVIGYADGYIPTTALEYLTPKAGYAYTGVTGSGFYKILIANRECHVFCDMVTDGGGWIVVTIGSNTSMEYLSNFGDVDYIKDRVYRDNIKGIGFDPLSDVLAFQMYNIPFSEIRTELSGDFDNPSGSKGRLRFITSSAGEKIKFENDGTNQFIYSDGVAVLSVIGEEVTKASVTSTGGTGEMNSLTIKFEKESDSYFSRRYISMLKVR